VNLETPAGALPLDHAGGFRPPDPLFCPPVANSWLRPCLRMLQIYMIILVCRPTRLLALCLYVYFNCYIRHCTDSMFVRTLSCLNMVFMRNVGNDFIWLNDLLQSNYLRFDADCGRNLWKLLTDKWNLPHPSLVLSVAGGPVAKNYKHQYFLAALTKLVSDTSKWTCIFFFMWLVNQTSPTLPYLDVITQLDNWILSKRNQDFPVGVEWQLGAFYYVVDFQLSLFCFQCCQGPDQTFGSLRRWAPLPNRDVMSPGQKPRLYYFEKLAEFSGRFIGFNNQYLHMFENYD